MKNFVLSLSMILLVTACSTPTNNNSGTNNPTNGTVTNPSPSNPSTGTGGGTISGFATRQDFINFSNCLVAKPETPQNIKKIFGVFITTVSQFTDAQWSSGLSDGYNGYAKEYASSGCVK